MPIVTPRTDLGGGGFNRPLPGNNEGGGRGEWSGDRGGDHDWDGNWNGDRHGDRGWDRGHDRDWGRGHHRGWDGRWRNHRDWDRHDHDGFRLSFHFGSGWHYPAWYGGYHNRWRGHHRWHYRPYSYWYSDPWCDWPYSSVYWYRPHWSRWDCDPWPRHSYSTVVIGTGFSFGSSASVGYAYSSSSLIPSATVYTAPAYASDVVYADPVTISTAEAASTVPYVESLPVPAPEAELRSVTDRELADTYFRLNDFRSAIRIYSEHLSRHPGDVQALRSIGLALIADDQPEAGANSIERAYRIDPALAQRPIDLTVLQPKVIENILDGATRLAVERNTAAAWLTVAAIKQAQRENEPARSALNRAKAAGLDALVHEWMASETPF